MGGTGLLEPIPPETGLFSRLVNLHWQPQGMVGAVTPASPVASPWAARAKEARAHPEAQLMGVLLCLREVVSVHKSCSDLQ